MSLPSALPLGCRPARYFNLPPGGGARLLLRPWAGGGVLPRSFCPPPGPQWGTRLCCGGVGGGRRAPPPVSAGPPDGTCPRQVWRVHARMQGARRGPRGRGPSAYTVYRARTQICGNSKCSTRIGNPGLAELRRGLDSRSKAGKTAQGPLSPALGWFRALPATLPKRQQSATDWAVPPILPHWVSAGRAQRPVRDDNHSDLLISPFYWTLPLDFSAKP